MSARLSRTLSPNVVTSKRRFEADEDDVVKCSEFITVEYKLPDDEIREKSELRTVKVERPDEDMTRLPNRHEYEFFFDYVQKTSKGNHDVPEERVSTEIEADYLERIDRLVEDYTNEMPDLLNLEEDEELTPEQQEFYQAWLDSPYKQEYFDYMDSRMFNRTIKGKEKPSLIPRERRVYPYFDIYEHYRVDTIERVYCEYMKKLAKSKKCSCHQLLKSLGTSFLSLEDVKLLVSNFRACQNKLPPMIPLSRKFQPEVEEFLMNQLRDIACTRMNIKERAQSVKEKFGINIKPTDVSSFLQANGGRRKLVRTIVPEADNIPHRNARVKVVMKMVQLLEEGRLMVSVDETQINKNCTTEIYGWAPRGQNAIAHTGRSGKPIHIVAAVMRDQVVGYMLRDERIKDFPFKHFLSCLFNRVKQLIPDFKRKVFFLIDNACAHKTKVVRDFVESQGVTVLCNAPMTPQIQPIEFVFSMFKRSLGKHVYNERSDLVLQVYKSMLEITRDPRKIFNTYIHCLKTLAPALTFEELSKSVKPQTNAKLYGKLSDKLQIFNEVKKLLAAGKREEA
mmetsp:Transcript_2068/g.4746  ORF Transcript_2068/g.4746 Transcript_2068/m.4746 type:complete len:564 (+) Transcript_2068:2692-4383(+)